MKDLTSYTYYFEELIRRRFLYVDKTEYIWKMIQYSTVGYFLLPSPSLRQVADRVHAQSPYFRERKTSSKDWRFMTSLMIGNRIPSFILIWETAKRKHQKS